jgi:hypothetical protein
MFFGVATYFDCHRRQVDLNRELFDTPEGQRRVCVQLSLSRSEDRFFSDLMRVAEILLLAAIFLQVSYSIRRIEQRIMPPD